MLATALFRPFRRGSCGEIPDDLTLWQLHHRKPHARLRVRKDADLQYIDNLRHEMGLSVR